MTNSCGKNDLIIIGFKVGFSGTEYRKGPSIEREKKRAGKFDAYRHLLWWNGLTHSRLGVPGRVDPFWVLIEIV